MASARTTPGHLRVLRAGILTLTALLAVIGTIAAARATSGTKALTVTSEPLVVDAIAIYSALADANTVAAHSFMSGGRESAAQTTRYDNDIREVTHRLTDSGARMASNGGPGQPIRTLAEQLPVYTGLVEAARANNRQGLPVGSAYLTEADELARTTMLPAADQLLSSEQEQLARDYATASAPAFFAISAALALALAALLVVAQLFLARRTHRIFNVGLVASSVTLVVLGLVVGIIVLVQNLRFADAREYGTDPLDRAAHARIAALMQHSDDSLMLVSRSLGADFESDFRAGTAKMMGTDAEPGLLAPGSAAARAERAYLDAHRRVVAALDSGNYESAVALATSTAPDGGEGAFAALDRAIAQEVTDAQSAFADAIGRTEGMLSSLLALIPFGCFLIAMFAVLGIRPRLEEYR